MNTPQLFIKNHLWVILLPTMFLLLPPPAISGSSFVLDNLDNGISKQWKEKSFVGKTRYSVDVLDGVKCIKAESHGTASGLFYNLDLDPQQYQYISWKWRVDQIIEDGDASQKSGDDYAARLYVVFPGLFFWQTRALNYIWANKLEKDTIIPNAYTSKAMMVAAESGIVNTGKFTTVQRNIYQDFKTAFGTYPPKIGAIAIMTDSDDTNSEASACYGPITLSTEK